MIIQLFVQTNNPIMNDFVCLGSDMERWSIGILTNCQVPILMLWNLGRLCRGCWRIWLAIKRCIGAIAAFSNAGGRNAHSALEPWDPPLIPRYTRCPGRMGLTSTWAVATCFHCWTPGSYEVSRHSGAGCWQKVGSETWWNMVKQGMVNVLLGSFGRSLLNL